MREIKEQIIRAVTTNLTIKKVLKLPETEVLIELIMLCLILIIVSGKMTKLFANIKK